MVEVVYKAAQARNFDKLDRKRASSAGKRRKTWQWVSTQTFSRIATTSCEAGHSQTGDTNMVNN